MIINIRYRINNLYDYLAALLIFSLPFSNSIPNILMGCMLLVYCIDFDKESIKAFSKSPFIILLALIGFVFIQALCSHSFLADFTYYKKYLYLAVIPFLFFKTTDLNLLKKATLASVFISILVSVYKIVKFYTIFKYLPFADGWTTNFVLLLERPYQGLFCLIAIIISFDLFISSRKIIYLASLFLSLGFIFMISIRTSLLTFFVLFVIYTVFYLKISIKIKTMLFAGLLAIAALLFMTNKNIAKRFYIKDSISETVKTTEKFEPRVVIYGCVKKVIQDPGFSILFGNDSYTAQQKNLNDCYAGSIDDYYRRVWFVEQGFNTHSQFIDFFLIGGILAFVLFLSFMILIFTSVYKDFAATAIVFSFLMILLIENVFHRQFGCLLFAVFSTLYFRDAKTPKTIENL